MWRTLAVVPVGVGALAAVAAASGAFSSGQAGGAMAHEMRMANVPRTAPAKAPATVKLRVRTVSVTIRNFAFVPAHLVVSPGTKITWTNDDSDPHTVTADRRGFGAQALDTGGRYSVVLRRAGSYGYHCTIHPYMTAAVVVQG
jgi:plastocyanin